jgi:hypothetical protein
MAGIKIIQLWEIFARPQHEAVLPAAPQHSLTDFQTVILGQKIDRRV